MRGARRRNVVLAAASLVAILEDNQHLYSLLLNLDSEALPLLVG